MNQLKSRLKTANIPKTANGEHWTQTKTGCDAEQKDGSTKLRSEKSRRTPTAPTTTKKAIGKNKNSIINRINTRYKTLSIAGEGISASMTKWKRCAHHGVSRHTDAIENVCSSDSKNAKSTASDWFHTQKCTLILGNGSRQKITQIITHPNGHGIQKRLTQSDEYNQKKLASYNAPFGWYAFF